MKPFNRELLRCVHEYLTDRGVLHATLYMNYIEVPRRRKSITIGFTTDTMVTCQVTMLNPAHATLGKKYRTSALFPTPETTAERSFDIGDPSSLQAIYEFVTSKKNK